MKKKFTILVAIGLFFAVGTQAQGLRDRRDIQHDRTEIRHERNDRREDRRDLRNDHRDIRHYRRDLYRDHRCF